MTDSSNYDVVIGGGGMVGATLACALSGHGLRIAVVEAKAPPSKTPAKGMPARVSALTPASVRIFTILGAWDAMIAQGVTPFREMHVWDGNSPGAIHFDSAEVGEPVLGYIVENHIVQAALQQRLHVCDDVDWLCPAQVAAVEFGEERVLIRLHDGVQLSASLVVGADGADSQLRTLAGITTQGHGYDQKALVATVGTSEPHCETAWQVFLPSGPLAFLPFGACCSIVWSADVERADELLGLDDAAFLAELETAFGGALGRMESVGPRAAFPLRRQHAQGYVRSRIALAGDAAHVIHPLAGQGVNLGLADAATLAEVLVDARCAGKDIGALRVLRRYERWRKGDNLAMMTLMDGFKQLFGSRLGAVCWARGVGMRLTDGLTPLKGLLVSRAMGAGGDRPKLARGESL